MQLLGPLWEGAPPAGGGGENLAVIRNASGTVEVLSLRPCGATSLPEGGKFIIPADTSRINNRSRFADPHRRLGDLFPAGAAAYAVGSQAEPPLARLERVFRRMAEDAVQRVRRITQRVQRVLQNQHVGAAAAAPHGGVACRCAAARWLAVPPVKVYPGGCHRQRLHVTPRPGPHSGVVNFAALCGSAALPHVERHARIVLARRAVAAVQPLVHWAAYLPPEQGQPKPDELPTAFIAVLQDDNLPGASDVDVGLALGSLTAAAWAHGVGSCIMGAIDRPALTRLLALSDGVRLCYMVALGYPTHVSKLVEMQDGSVKYYLDENRGYCVPKRSMDEVLLKTL